MTIAESFTQRLRRRFSEEAAARLRSRTAVVREAMISFTFDDVPDSAYDPGARILEDYGVHGTFYIAGSLCGTVDGNDRYIAAQHCADLHRRGHEIGCHTFSHCHVGEIDGAATRDEISLNGEFFRQLGGIRLDNFAYPFGGVSLARKRQLEQVFQTCRGTMAGINAGRVDLGFLRAVVLHQGLTPESVQSWIDRAAETRGWLIFLAHDVSPHPSRWGCEPAFLQDIVARATRSPCAVLSVRDALARIQVPASRGEVGLTTALPHGPRCEPGASSRNAELGT